MNPDILDYPTAWSIQRQGVTHTDDRCSASQTGGAMLCDCGAVRAEWERQVRSLADEQSKDLWRMGNSWVKRGEA